MDLRASISLLLLLLIGLSQALPVTENELERGISEDETDQILDVNNGSSELLMEGDLVVPKTRNALACWNNQCLWRKSRNGTVEVPFTTNSAFYSYYQFKIRRAMDVFHRTTCIRFVPRSTETDYVSIESRDGCFSYLGRTGGRQVLSLNTRGCVRHGIIQHELLHALGFQHEQSRSDRDKYVRINWQYIRPETRGNFAKRNTNNLDIPYDYGSVMHYRRYAFTTTRGRETITPIPNSNVKIGQRTGMSKIDIQRINKLYQC
ncbi:hatching enzyme 1.2-like [Engraulis encrasicolus]|uniref:hatching enzyme 1.2-like n=1 Tax=Engraulis encrasicolus TaxID=184585 RepID=UPI002FD15038